MSPTEFSNYIKQRAMQQQLHHGHGHGGNNNNGHLGPIGTASPSRSISPNPLAVMNGGGVGGVGGGGGIHDPYFFQSNGMSMYQQQQQQQGYGPANGQPRNMFESPHFTQHPSDNNSLYATGGGGTGMGGNGGKYSPYLEPHNFFGMNGIGSSPTAGYDTASGQTMGGGGVLQQLNGGSGIGSPAVPNGINNGGGVGGNNGGGGGGSVGNAAQTPVSSPGSNSNAADSSKLLDGLNSFYSNPGPYQHLLVAN